MEPISFFSGGIAIGQGIYGFLKAIKEFASSDIISGYFKWDGERIYGSEEIRIDRIQDKEKLPVWWYSVGEVDDYTFVRIPMVSSGIHELLGTVSDEDNPDAKFWRWVALPEPNVIVGGNYIPPNAKVNFIIVGYKPRAIIDHFSK